MKIGVLALQGDFERHQASLALLKVGSIQVRTPRDLEGCQGLVMPGGESTTLIKLLKESGLFQIIPGFAKDHPIFGTCAGLILMAREVTNISVESFGLLDISVTRNAYGKQINSFIDTITIDLNGKEDQFEGVFIRAPKIVKIGKGVNVLGRYNEEIVFVENGHHLATTFHPELSASTLVHKYFLGKVEKKS
jgi:5'-phosphate synthase pdxT subunit